VYWGVFEQLLAVEAPPGVRLAYRHGVLELMSPLPIHERIRTFLSRLIYLWSQQTGTAVESLGSMTILRPDLRQGIEPDACFYVQNLEAVIGRERLDFRNTPPPDLAVEVDITSSSEVRQPVYAALGIPELWVWSDERLQVFQWHPEGYRVVTASRSLPGFPVELLTPLVLRLSSESQDSLLRLFQAQLQNLSSG
jgi:Uma2 family endonuclease